MSTRLTILLLPLLLAAAANVYAQEMTEIYIPIGQSPGLSGTHTMLGTIAAVDTGSRTLTVTTESGESRTVRVGEDTRIWLDRSKSRLKNIDGSFSDCVDGRRVEVYFGTDDRTQETAVWIKLEVSD